MLGSKDKRSMYDQFGHAGVNNGGPGGPGGPGQGDFGGFNGGNFGDFFGDVFGGAGGPFGGAGGGFGGQRAQQKPKLESTLLEVQVTLEDLFYGKSFEVRYNSSQICSPCGGKGGSNVQTCGTCQGAGFVIKSRNMGGMMMQTQEICGACQGQGEVTAKNLLKKIENLKKNQKIHHLTSIDNKTGGRMRKLPW